MKRKISISLFFAGMAIFLCIGIMIGSFINQITTNTHSKEEILKKDSSVSKKSDTLIIHDIVQPVSVKEDKITADTTYLILKKDMNTGDVSKILSEIPQNYIGLNREQLLESLKDFESNPPLIELERGFISLELIAFSPKQVEIQMNYKEEKPTGVFYIMVYDNKLVVMLEDKKTIFLSTEIPITNLPSEVQQDVIRGLFIPNELSLYDFLENYTS